MGNFSRDPDARADFAVAKQYVAVRLQQGVPVLDADWNLLDDLRRRDSETLGGQFIGDGVPTGSDGFRIFQVGAPQGDPPPGKQDFGISQGLVIVNGKLLQIDKDFRYTDQPNFNNPAVDPPVTPLELSESEKFIVYLDTWQREVDSQGEETLVDPHIGIETAILLKREWAVRLVLLTKFSDIVAATPSGHFFYALAQLNWIGGSQHITDDMLAELRDTDASPRREIAYRRGKSTDVLVNTKMFLETLETTRDSVSDFLEFLTTKFVNSAVPYSAAEVMGFESLSSVASLADHGIAFVNARAFDTRGALLFFAQLFEAEKRFLKVWKAVVLPVFTPNGYIYNTAFKSMVNAIQAELVTIADALTRAKLLEAKSSQDKINKQFAGEMNKPTGFLLLTYLGNPENPPVTSGVPLDLRFRVFGSITPEDTLQVDRFIAPEWKTELRNLDGSPFNPEFGPGAATKEFLLTVTPRNTPSSTTLSLLVSASHNFGGLNQVSERIFLTAGAPPPIVADFAFTMFSNMSHAEDVFQITPDPLSGIRMGNLTFRLHNRTSTAAQVALFARGFPSPIAEWRETPPVGVDVNNQIILAQSQNDYTYRFQGPKTVGQSLAFRLEAMQGLVSKAQINVAIETA